MIVIVLEVPRMNTRNSVSRNSLQKEFSLDAASFPAHRSFSEKTVHRNQNPTTSIQQSRPHTISQYSSSVFSEKNELLGSNTTSF